MLANKNFAISTLASQLLSGGTTLTVQSGHASRFPATSFRGIIYSQAYGSPFDDPNLYAEIVTATFSSGDTFNIVRAQENTTARQWESGDIFIHAITAGKIRELETILAAESLTLTHNTAWNGSEASNLFVNVNGSAFTIANPSAAITNAFYSLYVTYTTSHAISFGSNFRNVLDLAPSNTAGMYDHFVFRFDGTYMICVAAAYDVRRS